MVFKELETSPRFGDVVAIRGISPPALYWYQPFYRDIRK
jgi:hypothetical protein